MILRKLLLEQETNLLTTKKPRPKIATGTSAVKIRNSVLNPLKKTKLDIHKIKHNKNYKGITFNNQIPTRAVKIKILSLLPLSENCRIYSFRETSHLCTQGAATVSIAQTRLLAPNSVLSKTMFRSSCSFKMIWTWQSQVLLGPGAKSETPQPTSGIPN